MSRVWLSRAALSALWLVCCFGRIAHAQPSAEGSVHKAVTPPRLIRFVPAVYPEIERAAGQAASVTLSIAIDAEGKVADVSVVQSAGVAFDEAAVAAVRQFEFSPARVDDAAVPVRIQYRYDFSNAPGAAPPPKPNAEFNGVVQDRKTGKPIEGVRVELDARSTTTDASGRFHFDDVEPGNHAITLSGSGFAPTGTEEALVAGQRYDANYAVELDPGGEGKHVDFELVIVDMPVQTSMASTSVSADQGARVAGTGGDVIKVVENLPGVARSSVGSGALVVWGAGAADTRVYVADVHVPLLYHEGGFRSVIHSDLVRNVELEPGGYGAGYGRGLGGLVRVELKPLQDEPEGDHGSLSLDGIDAAASVRGSIGPAIRFAAAVRRSHLDWVLSQLTSRDVGEFVPIPRYWDGQLRAVWAPEPGVSVEVGGLLSSDEIQRSVVSADPGDVRRESKHTDFERVYVRYQYKLQDGSEVSLTPFFGIDHKRVDSLFGATPASLEQHADVYGLRASWLGSAFSFLSLGTGVDIEVRNADVRREGSVTSPPREGDVRVFGRAPSHQINADDWQVTLASLAPYVQADLALLDRRLHVIPGLRFEPSVVRASRASAPHGELPAIGTMRSDMLIEPRLAARMQVSEALGLRAALGLYYQPPLEEELSAVFGNPLLGQGKATHYLAGATLRFTETLSIETAGFFAKQQALATRSALATPLEAAALVPEGQGRSYGGQLLLRQDLTHGFFGWLSYSLVRSERRDAGSATYRPFDFDQTHVLTALASYDLGAGFEVGARFRYATGYPRTRVLRAVYDSATDSFQPVFGRHNALRIPAFYQIDARVAKRFALGHDGELELYLDVQNATDHENPEELVYNYDFSRKSYITGLPILPVLGAKLTW